MPPPTKPTDKGHTPFEMVPGLTLPVWKGINKQGSPSNPAIHELRHCENIRSAGDGYMERGGQAKIVTAAVGSIEGIFEFTDVGSPAPLTSLPIPEGLYQFPGGQNWFSYTPDLATLPVRTTLPTAGITLFAKEFSVIGKLMIGTHYTAINSNLYLYQWDPVAGVTQAFAITVNFPDSSTRGRGFFSGAEHQGSFYFSLWDLAEGVFPYAHRLKIYRWDGVAAPVVDQETTVFQQGFYPDVRDKGIYSTWVLFSNGADLFAIMVATQFDYQTNGNQILRRVSDGVWASMIMPSDLFFGASMFGDEPGIALGAVAYYDGATYFCGNDQAAISYFTVPRTLKIMKLVDGASSLTTVWSRVNSSSAGFINLFVADGVLYYNYSDSAASVYRTGSFDGTTWNDNAKDWTAAPQSISQIPRRVVDFNGELVANGIPVGGGTNANYRTTGRSVTGLWSLTSGDADNSNWLEAIVG